MYNSSMIALILLLVSRAFGADVSSADDESVPVCVNDRRTVSNIVWSCLATVFASTWLAIHPNVPGRKITDKGALSCTLERAKIMGIAILAPEVIVSWAAEQFKVAWKVCHGKDISMESVIHAWRRKTQDDSPSLTMIHGFFFAMGSFCYTCVGFTRGSMISPMSIHANRLPDDSLGPVTVYWESERIVSLLSLRSEPHFAKDLEQINVKMIQDKSKGDALSKTISILQISWFIAQCIARAIQHLPITLLEMTALAFAGISIVTYSLWWYKPLNVQYPISLDKPGGRKYTPTRQRILPQSLSLASKNTVPFWSDLSIATVIDGLQWFMKGAMTTVVNMEADFGDVRDTEHGSFRFSSGRGYMKVLTKFEPNETWARFVTTVGVRSLYGAFHCVAWSFYFPSHAEMLLWRVSSVAVVIGLLAASHVPGAYLITHGNALAWIWYPLRGIEPEGMLRGIQRAVLTREPWGNSVFAEFILTVISCAGIIAYIVGRMTLVILAFMQLRSLPPLAFHTVQWTTYIPHI
ncbi:uncharacterized protein ARMOST_22177 [Armillaria ostoyae]|uniref:Uncharacterized protein n=1 Tax=Armillaria ostoyae TaxID=47428 RepID=A0A284SC63_ARMOS|nr:uncharacterized protein ARMOST_22177 [Armillaria ostoyae]